MKNLLAFLKDDSGATAIEYGMVVSIIALGVFSTQQQIAPKLNAIFNTVAGFFGN